MASRASTRICAAPPGVALLRYHGQGGELAIGWAGTREATEAAFAAEHQALYGFALKAAIELVTLRIEATGLTRAAAGDQAAVRRTRSKPTTMCRCISAGGA